MLDMMGSSPHLDAAAIQTVGTKDWDRLRGGLDHVAARNAAAMSVTRGSFFSCSNVTGNGSRQFGYSSTVPGRFGCRVSAITS